MKIKWQISKKNIIIFSSLLILVGSSVSGYFWYRSKIRSTSYFIQIISEHDANEETLQEAWPHIVLSARTTLHYMMLLKRLDRWNLTVEYKNTLVRALWRYPNSNSFLALAIEYYLTNPDVVIFDKYFKNVDRLWNEYPDLLRLYYINIYEIKKIKNQDDEILQLYYQVTNNEESWESLNTLWQLTDNPVFLYLAGIRAHMEGETIIAQTLYESFPLEWQLLYSEYYEKLAWVVNDIDFLHPIVEAKRDITLYFKLAGIYLQSNQIPKAYTILTEFKEISSSDTVYENEDFFDVYLWLAYMVEGLEGITKLEDEILQTKNSTLIKWYLTYLYSQDSKRLSNRMKSIDASITEDMLQDPFFYFLLFFADSKTIVQNQVFLWNIINSTPESERRTSWIVIALTYFLENGLFDDYNLLISETVDYEELLVPYIFYYNAKYDFTEYEQNFQTILDISDNKKYEWWHYYNVGIWHLNTSQYQQSELYLSNALQLLRTNLYDMKYINFPLTQLTRLYLLQKDIESATQYLSELESLYPTNPYVQILKNQIRVENEIENPPH